MQTGNHRTSIGFKANPETDQDIITWWEALPAGERSRALRDIVRAAINGQAKPSNGNGHKEAPMLEQVATDTAWVRSALMDLPGYLEALFSRIAVVHAETQPVSAEEQSSLDQQSVERRRANMKRSTW